jgi:hypothetical protein
MDHTGRFSRRVFWDPIGAGITRSEITLFTTVYHIFPGWLGAIETVGVWMGKPRHPRILRIPTLGGSSGLERGFQKGPLIANNKGLSHILSYYHTMFGVYAKGPGKHTKFPLPTGRGLASNESLGWVCDLGLVLLVSLQFFSLCSLCT